MRIVIKQQKVVHVFEMVSLSNLKKDKLVVILILFQKIQQKYLGYRLYIKNNSEKKLQDAIFADERAIDLACRFGYSIPNAYKSLGGALKELIEKTRKKKKRSFFEDRLDALRKSAEKARSELSQQEGSEKSVSSENVYGQ